jgi:hypothetical protein
MVVAKLHKGCLHLLGMQSDIAGNYCASSDARGGAATIELERFIPARPLYRMTGAPSVAKAPPRGGASALALRPAGPLFALRRFNWTLIIHQRPLASIAGRYSRWGAQ